MAWLDTDDPEHFRKSPGENPIAFTGAYPNAYLLTQLPEGTTNVQFYFYDDYGPNPPLYQYMYFWLLEATNSTGFAGFSMLDGGWGTTPPMTMNHYYARGQEEVQRANHGADSHCRVA